MGYFLLSAETSFSAAHTLPGVPLCERFHGHNWTVRLTVRMEENKLAANGMGVDFRDIETAITQATAEFDHQYLNEIPPFNTVPPTAENIARLVSERVTSQFTDNHNIAIEEVEIWEAAQYRVVYRPG